MVKSREDSVIEIWDTKYINRNVIVFRRTFARRLSNANPGIFRAIISSKSCGKRSGGRKIKMVVKIKEINEILRDSEDIKITYDSKTHEFKVSLYDLSADFIVKSIAGRTIDASLADIKRYLSKPWYLPATWIKEIVKE